MDECIYICIDIFLKWKLSRSKSSMLPFEKLSVSFFSEVSELLTVNCLIKPRPNDHNMPTQQIASLLGATWMLRAFGHPVATCWVLLAQILPFSNLSQQHPTCRKTVTKRRQHVAPNNVGICCVGMLRSFGRVLKVITFAPFFEAFHDRGFGTLPSGAWSRNSSHRRELAAEP